MHSSDQLLRALENAQVQPFSGFVYRIIAERHPDSPLSAIGSVQSGGRYNAPNSFPVLYCSDSQMTALLEVEALFNTADGQLKGAPRDLDLVLSLRCELASVLDLTDESFRSRKLLKVSAKNPYSGLKSGQKWQFLNLIQSTLTDLHRENVFGYPALLSYTE